MLNDHISLIISVFKSKPEMPGSIRQSQLIRTWSIVDQMLFFWLIVLINFYVIFFSFLNLFIIFDNFFFRNNGMAEA